MIYYDGRKWNKGLDALMSLDGFRSLSKSDLIKIERLLNKGENVYFMVNTYIAGMGVGEENHKDEFIWDTDEEKLKDLYYQLMENV